MRGLCKRATNTALTRYPGVGPQSDHPRRANASSTMRSRCPSTSPCSFRRAPKTSSSMCRRRWGCSHRSRTCRTGIDGDWQQRHRLRAGGDLLVHCHSAKTRLPLLRTARRSVQSIQRCVCSPTLRTNVDLLRSSPQRDADRTLTESRHQAPHFRQVCRRCSGSVVDLTARAPPPTSLGAHRANWIRRLASACSSTPGPR